MKKKTPIKIEEKSEELKDLKRSQLKEIEDNFGERDRYGNPQMASYVEDVDLNLIEDPKEKSTPKENPNILNENPQLEPLISDGFDDIKSIEESLESNEIPILDEVDNQTFLINSMFGMQKIIFDVSDRFLYTSGITKKTGLTDKFEEHREGFVNCYAGILKKHGNHHVIKYISDPIVSWGMMTASIIAAHVAENKA